jgi:hypothetical protein
VPNPNNVKIGTQAGGTGGMVTLKSLGIPAPLMDFQEFSQENILGDATVEGNGWSISEWHWGYLTAAQYNALVAFKTGKSTPVYTCDRKTGNAYANFLSNMVWPERERWENICVVDFTIRFIAMVEQ